LFLYYNLAILFESAKPSPHPASVYYCVHLEIETLDENIGRWETTWFNFHILHLICFNSMGYDLYHSSLVVLFYEPPYSANLPAHSPTLRTCPFVVHHTWSTSDVPPGNAASLKCEHGTYEPTSFVSPHESNRIWTSPLTSSRVHHHPWTYMLMA